MTVFCLVRHGAYPLIGRALGGREAHSLDEEGHAQAARVAAALEGRGVVAVVSSPVQRARETAAPIGARLGLPVAVAPEFAEIDFGRWTGATFASLHGAPGWRAWNAFRSTAPVPGGETMLAAQARAVAGVARLALAWPEGEVVVVSHADIIKAVLAHVLGMPLDLLRRMEVGPGSVSRIALHEEDARVLGMNQPP